MNKSKLSKQQKNGPKRWLYLLCENLGWNAPMFTDAVAGGYRLKYNCNSKEEAEALMEEAKASRYGKHIYKAYYKYERVYYGEEAHWAYMVIKRHEVK